MSKKYSLPSYEKKYDWTYPQTVFTLCYSAEFIRHSFSYLSWLSACPFVAELVYKSIPAVALIASFLQVIFIPMQCKQRTEWRPNDDSSLQSPWPQMSDPACHHVCAFTHQAPSGQHYTVTEHSAQIMTSSRALLTP